MRAAPGRWPWGQGDHDKRPLVAPRFPGLGLRPVRTSQWQQAQTEFKRSKMDPARDSYDRQRRQTPWHPISLRVQLSHAPSKSKWNLDGGVITIRAAGSYHPGIQTANAPSSSPRVSHCTSPTVARTARRVPVSSPLPLFLHRIDSLHLDRPPFRPRRRSRSICFARAVHRPRCA